MTDLPMIGRSCGECQKCCTDLPVLPLDKPAGERCKHQCAGGCAVYAERPEPCKMYTCAWLDGYFPEDFRPDKSGILLEKGWIEWPRTITLLMGFADHVADMEKIVPGMVPGGTVVVLIHGQQEMRLIGATNDINDVATWYANCQRNGVIRHRYADGRIVETEV